MKKLLLTLVSCFVAIAANAWTVKFTNPDGWSTPYIWAWIEGGSNFTGGNWPGQPMTKNSDGTCSFTYSGPIAGVPEYVIFSNNGSPQTGNLKFVDGATYDKSGPVGAAKYKYTVYFDNTNNWPFVNIYGWGSMGYTAGWPGSEMQKGSNGLYEFTFETTEPNPPVIGDGDGFLFYGGDDSRKTPDIKSFTNGATYYPNGTTTPPPAELTFYVIGDDVDGQSWALMTNQMTKTANGVYQWTGQKLGNKFKINDGTWGAQYNIGKGDDGTIKIGTPYHYYMGDGSADIEFDGFTAVTDPTVVLNTNDGTITLTGTPVYAPPTIYIVGANINGSELWGVGSNNVMTYNESSNTYTWEGTTLGAGFKFFNGSWDGAYNIGASGDQVASVVLGTPYTVYNNGDSQDLQFAYPTISNPKVTLNIDENSLTVTGTGVAPSSMYILGNIDGSEFTLDTEVEMTANSGVFTISDVNVTAAEGGEVGYIQFATEKATTMTGDEGWNELGLRLGPQTYNLAVELDETYNLASNGKNNYSFMLNPGVYDVEVSYTGTVPQVTFSQKPEPLYLMGYDEDGNVTLRQEMTPSSTDPKVYEYTYTVPNYSKGFKFYFSTTGKTEAQNNFVPTVANQSIRFGADNTYKATWSNVGVGNAIDYVAGETTFSFNIETLECELKYEGAFVNFEFTGVENAYYYVNMFNLTGDDNVVYLNSNSVQYGIDKSGLTGLMAAPKDGYTLKITCPEAQSQNTYLIQQGGLGDEQQILLYPGAQGYTFTFTVSEQGEPVYSFNGQLSDFDLEVDGNIASWVGVLKPEAFVIEKKVNGKVVETYKSNATEPGNQITAFGDYTGATDGTLNWVISAVVVNDSGSPIAFSFNTETLVLTVSTGLTASAGTADTQQSGTIENGAAAGNIDLVSNQDYAWVFFNVPEEATAVYYKVSNVTPLTNARRNAAPEGYQEADTWEWDSPEKGSYYAQLLSGTSGTLDVIYEIDGAQSKPTTFNYTVTLSVPTGVDGIDADEEGAEYYTIDGVKVLNPERGIFIRVQNGKVTKVVK